MSSPDVSVVEWRNLVPETIWNGGDDGACGPAEVNPEGANEGNAERVLVIHGRSSGQATRPGTP